MFKKKYNGRFFDDLSLDYRQQVLFYRTLFLFFQEREIYNSCDSDVEVTDYNIMLQT